MRAAMRMSIPLTLVLLCSCGGKNEARAAADSSATKATRGPSDKGCDESLGITAADLERLVKSLVDAATVKPTDGKESK